MERLFNKVLVALSITMLTAGSANGMQEGVTADVVKTATDAVVNTAADVVKTVATTDVTDKVAEKVAEVVPGYFSRAFSFIGGGLTAAYQGCTKENAEAAYKAAADSTVGQFVANHSTAFKVVGGVAATAAVAYLAKNKIANGYNYVKGLFGKTPGNNNQGGQNQTKDQFIQDVQTNGLARMTSEAFVKKTALFGVAKDKAEAFYNDYHQAKQVDIAKLLL